MQLHLIFLMTGEHPQQLMYLCPACARQNFTPATAQLGQLTCAACGISIDASHADLELLRPLHYSPDFITPAQLIY